MDSLTRYRNKCEEIIRELSHEPDQGSLYHYTTFNSLKNILKSRKLRYTHYKNLNDPTEIQFGLELIKESLTKNKFPDYYLQKTKEYFDAYKDECNTYLSSFLRLILWLFGDIMLQMALGYA
ncbi:Uncharacterised protein [Legionella feeleii]|uniref:Uncharacterized protein n=1 Tax=Legionella feeleii TaxID=453 RepID=A0A378ISJ8_9GAMM|nr:Uncharacterised protein [Legionella feeleii]